MLDDGKIADWLKQLFKIREMPDGDHLFPTYFPLAHNKRIVHAVLTGALVHIHTVLPRDLRAVIPRIDRRLPDGSLKVIPAFDQLRQLPQRFAGQVIRVGKGAGIVPRPQIAPQPDRTGLAANGGKGRPDRDGLRLYSCRNSLQQLLVHRPVCHGSCPSSVSIRFPARSRLRTACSCSSIWDNVRRQFSSSGVRSSTAAIPPF